MNDVTKKIDEPFISPAQTLPEITWRVIILGVILTIILAAANAYLGLKVGTTVSASIPAAVISMGILRLFKNANVLENTMVQIMASVGEALTAGIAFILPALIILRVWDHFSYWQTVLTALLGGGLGVLFTIPLRKALLQDATLRYPEATAISHVLKASTSDESDFSALIKGGVIGSVIAFCQTGLQILSDNFQCWFRYKSMIAGFGLGLSPALIAAGYIVGINVALSLLVGIVLGWLLGVPLLSLFYGLPDVGSVNEMAMVLWKEHIRYIGVGTMLIGGLWTLCTLIKPVIKSIAMSLSSLKKIHLNNAEGVIRTERDIPIQFVLIGFLVLFFPIFLLIAENIIPELPQISVNIRYFIAAFSTLYIFFGGFIFCSIMAYFAGLIGSTNSPVSGLLVSALLVISLLLMIFFNLFHWNTETQEMVGAIIAIGSMVIIGAALSISNDTMQDLKVGQLMGATPWKQQLMLIVGVVVTAFVIPPILELLYNAYGIGGVFPRSHMNPQQMLSAPQAGLMASIAKGVFSHKLAWGMISIGALIAGVTIVIDEILKRRHLRLPVLAVGLGIYLPLDSSVPVVVGGLLAYVIQRQLSSRYKNNLSESLMLQNQRRHRGLLLACGIVAGASLVGVILAIPFAIMQSADALRIMPAHLMSVANFLSLGVTTLLCLYIYYSVCSRY